MKGMKETVLHGSKGYKGCVRWVKLLLPSGTFKVERRRPFGWHSYQITKEEYDFIDSPKKAAEIWSYHHFIGTASWWGGEIKHPIKEYNTIADEALMNRDHYQKGLHYNSTMVDVVLWMFRARKVA